MVAIAIGASVFSMMGVVQAALLVYEPFDYAKGSLTGKNGGSGFSSGWQTTGTGADATIWGANAYATNVNAADWDGQVDNVPLSSASNEYRFVGGQMNNTAYNIDIYRTLSSSAGAMAGGDNILWMSAVIHLDNRGGGSGINIGLGDGGIRNRGLNWVGNSVKDWIGAAGYEKINGGSSGTWRNNRLNAVVLTNAWNTPSPELGDGTFTQGAALTSSSTTDNFVLVFKFTFAAGAGNDTCEAYAFDETVTLSEATFNANAVSATFAGMDETACTVLSYSANSQNNLVDEIRIGDTFADVISQSSTGATDVAKSTLVASPTYVDADGASASTITVTLLDGFGSPMTNHAVSLTGNTANASITTNASATDVNGQVTFDVVSSTVEVETFTATDDDDGVTILQTVSVPFLGTTDAGNSTVTTSRDVVVADGSDSATITITLRDSAGSVIPGNSITLAGSTGNATISPGGAQVSDSNGQVTFSVSSATAETEIFSATDATDSIAITQTASVTFSSQDSAKLIVYEPFDYAVGAIAGQNGGKGFSSAWTVPTANEEPWVWGPTNVANVNHGSLNWDGEITNITTSTVLGEPRFIGTETNNSEGKVTMYRTLSSSAGAMAGADGVLWMSAVCHLEDKNSSSGVNLGLGDGYIRNRGLGYNGGDMFVGSTARAGGSWTGGKLNAMIATNDWWLSNPTYPQYYEYSNGASLSGDDFVLVFKFIFSAGEDTVETYAFPEASVLSEATFDANKVSVTFSSGFDESVCTNLSLTAAQPENAIDELRIGNTFNDIAGIDPSSGMLFLIR